MADSLQSASAPARLLASGHPVHTRSLEVEVFLDAPGKVRVHAVILDLRKTGFVPTGGELQSSGIIHNMSLSGRVDVATQVLERLEPAQAVVAFEASPRTGGESCRDTIDRLTPLVGARLDAAFSKKLASVYGGALGCSHLLTLAHLTAATVPQALTHEREAEGDPFAAREPGERLFKRTLILDGFETQAESGGPDARPGMEVAMQLNDISTAPFARVVSPLDRFARQHEVQLLGRIDMSTMSFASLAAAERIRETVPLLPDGWQSRDALLSAFVGGPALYGLPRRIHDLLPATGALRDVMLNFAPGVIQCMAAFAHRMVERGGMTSSGEGPSIAQLGGQANSCYIWREDGPGMRLRGQARERLEGDRGLDRNDP